ncbi:uncharacterized protein CAALFM_C300590WA [Candida albicans SC5314]|uniref:Uncharacterized protein n=1 Tax=Candida albicans (strain SC5314 / ATCC MYA-2876) TaxID=237561 RepID=Q5A7R4_CANAL|nr:uncharacterized protein CAALFM_C300590WA [Candida albicans SC5314]AOW28109.1 hypothetical protein CAALFM_C300590WA [Candida albicans SC5314]|eukprot:XP_436573.1 hypothetical protein CAALFM_C300590WA [Candida albicans SC5314]
MLSVRTALPQSIMVTMNPQSLLSVMTISLPLRITISLLQQLKSVIMTRLQSLTIALNPQSLLSVMTISPPSVTMISLLQSMLSVMILQQPQSVTIALNPHSLLSVMTISLPSVTMTQLQSFPSEMIIVLLKRVPPTPKTILPVSEMMTSPLLSLSMLQRSVILSALQKPSTQNQRKQRLTRLRHLKSN